MAMEKRKRENLTDSFICMLEDLNRHRRISAKSVWDIASSAKPIIPSFCDSSGGGSEVYLAKRILQRLIQAPLDWQKIREHAERLALERERLEEQSEQAYADTRWIKFSDLGDGWLTTLSLNWTAAWNSRNVNLFVSLFAENGSYDNPKLGRSVRGSAQIRKVFSELIRLRKTSMIIEGICLEPFIMKWTRAVQVLNQSKPSDLIFAGESLFQFAGNRILHCGDTWSLDTDQLSEIMPKHAGHYCRFASF